MKAIEVRKYVRKELQKANDEIRMLKGVAMISKHNTVVMFESNNTTVDIGEDSVPFITSSTVAAQFTPDAADELCRKVLNGHEERPIPVSPLTYYTRKKEELENVLEELVDL